MLKVNIENDILLPIYYNNPTRRCEHLARTQYFFSYLEVTSETLTLAGRQIK